MDWQTGLSDESNGNQLDPIELPVVAVGDYLINIRNAISIDRVTAFQDPWLRRLQRPSCYAKLVLSNGMFYQFGPVTDEQYRWLKRQFIKWAGVK